MQTVRLDISNDIFDKVMFLLQNLPKNKVKLSFENKQSYDESQNSFDPKEFFGVANSSKKEIDIYLSQSRDEWDNGIYEK